MLRYRCAIGSEMARYAIASQMANRLSDGEVGVLLSLDPQLT
jgi:hypothetical protein